MERVFEFLTSHPYLVGVFVVLLGLFIRNETQRGGASVSAQQLVELVNREDAVIVDVRDKKEFDAGHIVDSINVPHGSLESHVDELKKFVDRPLVVACKMGQHSGAAELRQHPAEVGLGAAIAVAGGGVEVGDAQVKGAAHRLHLLIVGAADHETAHIAASEADL